MLRRALQKTHPAHRVWVLHILFAPLWARTSNPLLVLLVGGLWIATRAAVFLDGTSGPHAAMGLPALLMAALPFKVTTKPSGDGGGLPDPATQRYACSACGVIHLGQCYHCDHVGCCVAAANRVPYMAYVGLQLCVVGRMACDTVALSLAVHPHLGPRWLYNCAGAVASVYFTAMTLRLLVINAADIAAGRCGHERLSPGHAAAALAAGPPRKTVGPLRRTVSDALDALDRVVLQRVSRWPPGRMPTTYDPRRTVVLFSASQMACSMFRALAGGARVAEHETGLCSATVNGTLFVLVCVDFPSVDPGCHRRLSVLASRLRRQRLSPTRVALLLSCADSRVLPIYQLVGAAMAAVFASPLVPSPRPVEGPTLPIIFGATEVLPLLHPPGTTPQMHWDQMRGVLSDTLCEGWALMTQRVLGAAVANACSAPVLSPRVRETLSDVLRHHDRATSEWQINSMPVHPFLACGDVIIRERM